VKTYFVGLALVLLFASEGRAEDYRQYLPSMEESRAYQQYSLRPKVELSKLIYLLDRFRESKLEVIFDGNPYPPEKAADHAKVYLSKHYHREEAKRWIKLHVHRSITKNEVIYARFPTGKKKPAKDILLKELEFLDDFDKAPQA